MSDDDLKRIATRILEQVGFKASCYGNQVCWFGHDTNLCSDDEMMQRCLEIIKEELGMNRSGRVSIFTGEPWPTAQLALSDQHYAMAEFRGDY